MAEQHQHDRWMQDIEDRQRNVVFPDTVENETRFWRNLGNSRWTIPTKIGTAIPVVFVCGGLTIFLRAALQEHGGWVGAFLGARDLGPLLCRSGVGDAP